MGKISESMRGQVGEAGMWSDEVAQLKAENKRLRDAIQRALDDEESGEGWGPDISVCKYLIEALGGE